MSAGEVQGPAQVLHVLLRHRRHAHRGTGQVDALVVGHRPADDDPADHVGLGHLLGDQGDPAVVDEQLITGVDVAGQAVVRRTADGHVTGDFPGGDGEALAVGQRDLAFGELGQPDLRALQVDEDADVFAGLLRCSANPVVDALMLGVGAVAEVQPSDVHTCLDEFQDALRGGRSRAERTNDLCATHVTKPYSYKTTRSLVSPRYWTVNSSCQDGTGR